MNESPVLTTGLFYLKILCLWDICVILIKEKCHKKDALGQEFAGDALGEKGGICSESQLG